MASATETPQSPTVSVKSSPSAGTKRKREAPTKFYAVRVGHKPGVYHTYPECLSQVKNHSGAQFKSFTTLTEAENFVKNGPDVASRFSHVPQKYYGVRAGFNPGIYTDWPTAKKQVDGYTKPRHKSFHTKAEAQAFIDGNDNPEPEPGSRNSQVPKKNKTQVATNEIDESIPPGDGPMPPISEDGFDARITLNGETRQLEYKNHEQRSATKMQPTGPTRESAIKIYTDGAAPGNGKAGARAGFGVYFGPMDARNVAARLPGPRQTNQRGELAAIQRAIDLAPKDHDIEIISDSMYGIECVTNWFQAWRRNGWRTAAGKAVENKDLVENIIDKIEGRHRVGSKTAFQWVKGHARNPGNIGADSLAVTGAQMAMSEENEDDVDAQ